MDRRQKYKKCRMGVVEPTFNGEEMKCFPEPYILLGTVSPGFANPIATVLDLTWFKVSSLKFIMGIR
ncbi:MAG TPA: hypothetical protein VF884_06645 [Nitrososphaeraceae archaeon]